jgi:hypothetical protein
MFRARFIRAGILFAIAAAGTTSCGDNKFTEPGLQRDVVAVRGFERFLNSAQRESRELLIDGRVTNIEWDLTGNPSVILLQGGGGGGGSYYVLVRSLWTLNQFNETTGFYLLLQWADRSEDRLQEPLVTSADVLADNADTLINCDSGDDTLVRESSWSRSTKQEDQVWVELFSDSLASYPADVWRWGAETTDPATPVNGTEFIGATQDGDSLGSTTHPGAGFLEDLYDMGGGAVRDAGDWTYIYDNHNPGSNVPLFIASKGSRDSRLNRAKPTQFVLWHGGTSPVGTIEKPFGPCEYSNPIREDDASVRDKTWNPGDYVPSFRLKLPSESQLDVIGKGEWLEGKWALEIRRDLRTTQFPDSLPPPPPRSDDVELVPGRRYMMRITIYDGSTKTSSQSQPFPIYLRP